MARIKTTGNHDVDTATVEIALALGVAHPGWLDQECYNAAMNLRDAIMAGTRELDAPLEPLENFTVAEASDDRNLREHTEATASGSQDYLWRWLEHGQDEA